MGNFKKMLLASASATLAMSLLVPVSSASASDDVEYKKKKIGLNLDSDKEADGYLTVKIPKLTTKDYKNKQVVKTAQKTLDDFTVKSVEENQAGLMFVVAVLNAGSSISGNDEYYDVSTNIAEKAESKKFISYKVAHKMITKSKKKNKTLEVKKIYEYVNISKATGKKTSNLNTVLSKKVNEKNGIKNMENKIRNKHKLSAEDFSFETKNLNKYWYMDSKNNVIVDFSYLYTKSDNIYASNIISKISKENVLNKYKK